MKLRRDYYQLGIEECEFPNGVLCDLQNKDRHFAFGIYPFVKSGKYQNIYKVLFYNDFKWPENYQPQPSDALPYEMKFFYFDDKHQASPYSTENGNVIWNQTNKANKDFDVNTLYYHVESDEKYMDPIGHQSVPVSIDFAELSVRFVKNPQAGIPDVVTGTAIIMPQYHDVAIQSGPTNIAVDLGTSNTYIAYEHPGDQDSDGHNVGAREISTIHDGWHEFALMNNHCTKSDRQNIRPENEYDLYLKVNDNKEADDVCLNAQLCEFIPSSIKKRNDYQNFGYDFPIPSVVNRLRIGSRQLPDFTNRKSMVHSSIPFAYYKIGMRKNTEANIYDSISTGEFKWFYGKNDNGIYTTDREKEGNFNSFLEELMFIIRSHILCRGFELDKCVLIWTYPLAFPQSLLEPYQAAWELAYCKFFNPSYLRNGSVDVDRRGELSKNHVKFTNESRSPIYDCQRNPGDQNKLTVLMDIGGGTTDVIGYYKNDPKFVTSFGFAGNSLYLTGNLNNNEFEGNYMREFVKRTFESNPMPVLTDSLNTLMNYGFNERNSDFKSLFNNDAVKFMQIFHNAALFYHTAQLCKLRYPDEVPSTIYMTGNGSNLIKMNPLRTTLLNKVFGKVYEKDVEVELQFPDYPKATTSKGALKGMGNGLKFNEESKQDRVILLGDSKTVYEVPANENSAKVTDNGYLDNVKQNVTSFIELFEQIIGEDNMFVKKDEIIKEMDSVGKDKRMDVAFGLTDSLFFQYVSLLMEQMSVKICKKLKFKV